MKRAKDFKCVDCGKEVDDIQGHYERVHGGYGVNRQSRDEE